MTTKISPNEAGHAIGEEITDENTTVFASSLSRGDCSYRITVTKDGKVWEWNDFTQDAQLTEHGTYNDAVESIIGGCEILYCQHHEIDECDVTRTFDGDGRIAGFRLSRDVDGQQHGDDERFGEF